MSIVIVALVIDREDTATPCGRRRRRPAEADVEAEPDFAVGPRRRTTRPGRAVVARHVPKPKLPSEGAGRRERIAGR